MYFILNSEVYLKYTSFQKKSQEVYEVIEVGTKYLLDFFCFYTSFILFLGKFN